MAVLLLQSAMLYGQPLLILSCCICSRVSMSLAGRRRNRGPLRLVIALNGNSRSHHSALGVWNYKLLPRVLLPAFAGSMAWTKNQQR